MYTITHEFPNTEIFDNKTLMNAFPIFDETWLIRKEELVEERKFVGFQKSFDVVFFRASKLRKDLAQI